MKLTVEKKRKISYSVFNALLPILIALTIGGVLIAVIGENPFETYGVMIQRSLFSVPGLLRTLHFAAPLILTGLAIAITFKANIFNMGVEGQMLLGAFFSGIAGFSVKLPPLAHITLCLAVGIVTGVLFALIPAVLKAFFNVNEMVVTLMLNYVAIEGAKYLAQGVFKDPSSGYVATYTIHATAMFNKFGKYNFTAFFFVALAAFVIIFIVMKKSRLGYEITAIGKNPIFAEASGMRVARKIIVMMVISGAISGLAGAGWMMSEKYKYTTGFSGVPGLGWDGMLIALLGTHNPAGVLVAAVFYAALKTGSAAIGLFTKVPTDIVGVIQGILILCLSVKFFEQQTGIFARWRERKIARKSERRAHRENA